MKLVLLCLSVSLSATAFSADLSRKDFAFGAQLQTESVAPAYEFNLPLQALRQTAFSDLRDIRVFNADDQPVPYEIHRAHTEAAATHTTIALPMFPLKGEVQEDINKELQSMRVHIATESGNVNVLVPAASKRTTGQMLAYLLDARDLKSPINALDIKLNESAESESSQNISATMSVEASDDLAIWHTLRSSAPIVSLEYNGQRLRQQRIEVATHAKFLRLTWMHPPTEKIEITAIDAEVAIGATEPTRTSLHIAGVVATNASDEHRLEYLFDTAAHAPIDRVDLVLPDANSFINAQMFSRPTLRSQEGDTPWRWIGQGNFYRLQYEAQEIHSRPLAIAPTTDRYWSIRLNEKSAGLGKQSPQLKIEWLPVQVVFLARGKGPYWFAFGNASAESAETSLNSVLKTTSSTATAIQPGNAHTLTVEEVGGVTRLQVSQQRDWKTIALWLSLVIGVALLAWMAIRLLRDMNAKSP